MRLFDSPLSGNCYKVRLLLAHLGLDYDRVEIDVVSRDERAGTVGDRNPSGRIPVLELDDGRSLAESNAILCYLAEGTDYLPRRRFTRAQVLQWLFFEQNGHEPFVAVARYLTSVAPDPGPAAALARLRERGREALAVLDRHLHGRDFLVADRYTIADMALFAYSHVAHEGGIGTAPYRKLVEWIERVRAQPGFVPMVESGP